MRARVAAVLVVVALLAAPLALAASSKARVANERPSVGAISGPSSVTPTAGGNTTVTLTLAARDPNGHADLARVTVEVLRPDGTVLRPARDATPVSGNGQTRTFSYSFSMAYHDPPTSGEARYKAFVTALDSKGQSATNSASLYTFAFEEIAALSVETEAVDFGADLAPGDKTPVVAVPVENRGNVRIDVTVAGTALAHASENAAIPASRATYATAANMTGSAPLATTAATLADFDLDPAGARDLYFEVGVPDGGSQWLPAGRYTGTLTLGAIEG